MNRWAAVVWFMGVVISGALDNRSAAAADTPATTRPAGTQPDGPQQPRLRLTLNLPGPAKEGASYVRALVFSPDGKMLACAGDDNAIQLWEVASGHALATLEGHTAAVLTLAFSPDGKTLASGGADKTIRLWDVAAAKAGATVDGGDMVGTVAFSPDGKTLASGSAGNIVRVWDLASGKSTVTVAAQGYRITSVAFSPDGKILAFATEGGGIGLWNRETGQTTPIGHLDLEYYTPHLVFSPDGKRLVSGGYCSDGVQLWDVASGANTANLKGHQAWGAVPAFLPDGKTLLTVGHGEPLLRFWDAATGANTGTFALTPGDNATYRCAALSPDGKTLGTGFVSSGKIELWDLSPWPSSDR